MKRLAASYNPVATRVVEKANEKSKNMDVVNFMIDLAVFAQTTGIKTELGSGRDEERPNTFREAWDHPNMEKRNKWRDAIKKEFNDMTKRGVWRKISRSEIPDGRTCVKSKWVFDIKRSGKFRACIVANGYSQIP